jgi:phosphatidylserine/phosphatidylglycerophosphate/cardiolipin synthase-like enzyme
MGNRPLEPVMGNALTLKNKQKSILSGDYFASRTEMQFVTPRNGNHAVAFTNGREAMQAMAKAIKAAQKFIFIADWQMNFDTELIGRGDGKHEGRLSELIHEAINARKVDVRVMLYDSIEAAAYTHENEARATLLKLKTASTKGNIEVGLHNPATGRKDGFNIAFSHHQKILLVDGEIAFLGGLDIAHGRWDDGNFDVVCDPRLHVLNDHYNNAYRRSRSMTADEEKLTQPGLGLGRNERPGFAPAYYQDTMTVAVSRLQELWSSGAALSEVMSYADKAGLNDLIVEKAIDKMVDMAVPGYGTATKFINKLGDFLKSINNALAEADQKYKEGITANNRAWAELGKGNIAEAVKYELKAQDDIMNVVIADIERSFLEKYETLKKSAQALYDAAAFAAGKAIEYTFDPSKIIADAQALLEQAKALIRKAQGYYNDLVAWINKEPNLSRLLLKPGCQPRMPWQDVHASLKGPVVFDVYKNFARRWNAMVAQNQASATVGQPILNTINKGIGYANKILTKPLPDQTQIARGIELTMLDAAWLTKMGGKEPLFGDVTKPGTAGNMKIQILRSMGSALHAKELAASQKTQLDTYDGPESGPAAASEKQRQKDNAARDAVTIQDSMLHCIASANAYIYIESQFFISDCKYSDAPAKTKTTNTEMLKNVAKKKVGIKESVFEESPASNCIAEAIANRISLAIVRGKGFHVYIVLPVHPEGSLLDDAVVKQQYWIQQTIWRGRYSLIRRVCTDLLAHQKKLPANSITEEELQAELKKNNAGWKKYITVLNLRNFGVLHDPSANASYVVTEQCYVHSKVMIVDDAVAIIGSANTNDRSLNGDGDTEIAAVIVDGDTKTSDLGNGSNVVTRKFARELRETLWKKFLGESILTDGLPLKTKGYTQAKEGLLHPPRINSIDHGVKISEPAAPTTYETIQRLANENAAIYEEVFQHVPRNSMSRYDQGLNGLPQAGYEVKADLPTVFVDRWREPPDLQPAYMSVPSTIVNNVTTKVGTHNVATAFAKLQKLTGFWVAMPLDWGHGMTDPASDLPKQIIADIGPRHNAHSQNTQMALQRPKAQGSVQEETV